MPFLVLIILREFVVAFATFVKDRRPFIDASQLHRVEGQLVVPAFGTWFFNRRVLLHLLLVLVLTHPRWLGHRGAFGYHFSNMHLGKPALVGTKGANNIIALWRIQYRSTHWTKRPATLFTSCTSFTTSQSHRKVSLLGGLGLCLKLQVLLAFVLLLTSLFPCLCLVSFVFANHWSSLSKF